MILLYEGKSKRIFQAEKEDEVVIEYKDEVTAFNSLKKASITNKGIVCSKISAYIYKYLHDKGVPSHFVKQIDDTHQLCKKVDVVALEVIVRNIASGSIVENLGFKEGYIFEEPIIEFCYKDDALKDPMVNSSHIKALKLCDEKTLESIKEMTLNINKHLIELFSEANITVVDFKLEFGHDKDNTLLLADEISPDNMRLWDKDTNEKLDKDTYRHDIGDLHTAYTEVLNRLEAI
ncbi:MAG: phosphoribosylaminoimidazolesuccinocarboxamide synthase [Erysipelothrix sp.]|nr:phosphoribosylaminoimidazolesuccinocarboxamide synthase [Erysipelothrix sp.]